jgi:6-phosphogluconate dehydrogenase (decarboxylating)
MQIGMIGLGRMGAGMVRRLLDGGHQCVVYDRNPEAVATLAGEGAIGTSSLEDFVDKLQEPRAVWLMVPAAVVDNSLYDFNLTDITELWRRGSVIASWLLDLTASALLKQPDLSNFSGRVSDSGEGRWTITAAIDESAPAPVLSAALYQRFTSRGEDGFATRVLSAMRFEFGGHVEKQR